MVKRKRASKDGGGDDANKASKSTQKAVTLQVPAVRTSDEVNAKREKWINKQRVLIFSSRGITFRDRHLMQNLRNMMPHSKQEPKMDSKDPNLVINEICETRNCNKCIYIENRKRKDTYMWIANVPRGPSAKFLVENIHTMEELRMTGNSLKGSRPILSFDKNFDKIIHLSLLKELFVQTFGTPNHYPKSQPFVDHVISFSYLDSRIWFRNYQIIEEDGSLAEIGPRFVLNLIKIFDGSFGGSVLYSNPQYVSPNKYRIQVKKEAMNKYKDRILSKVAREKREPKGDAYKDIDEYDEIFETIPPEQAKGALKNVFERKRN